MISSSVRMIVDRFHADNLEHFENDQTNEAIAFDHVLVNAVQFSSLMISFVDASRSEMIICALIDFFRLHYRESDEDQKQKKKQVRSIIEEQYIRRVQFVFLQVTTETDRCGTTSSN
jgi:hypothetical protein